MAELRFQQNQFIFPNPDLLLSDSDHTRPLKRKEQSAGIRQTLLPTPSRSSAGTAKTDNEVVFFHRFPISHFQTISHLFKTFYHLQKCCFVL